MTRSKRAFPAYFRGCSAAVNFCLTGYTTGFLERNPRIRFVLEAHWRFWSLSCRSWLTGF